MFGRAAAAVAPKNVAATQQESQSDAATKPLREIQAAGKFATFVVQVHHQDVEEYTYTRSGQPVQGIRLNVRFVSNVEAEYVTGRMTMWRGDRRDLDSAASRFQVGLHFQMTQVGCLQNEQGCYISSPVKVVVDLRTTKFTPLLQGLHEKFQAGPPTTLADIVQLPDGRQRFDVTAVARLVGEAREVTTKFGQRVAQEIVLRDGSKLVSDQQAEVRTSLFFPTSQAQRGFSEMLARDPVFTFFALDVQKQCGETTVVPSLQGFHFENAACTRADSLRAEVEAGEVWKNEGQLLTNEWQPKATVDYSHTRGLLSCCALLMKHQKDDAVYVHERMFQLNHVHVPPPPKTVTFEDRLFWTTRIRDFSGTVEVGIRQHAACQLADIQEKENRLAEFRSQHDGGILSWPLLSSVKVLATVKDASASQEMESQTSAKHLRLVVVEAMEQDLKVLPTTAVLDVLSTLNSLPVPQDGLMTSRFGDLHTNSFGVFQVETTNLSLPGTETDGTAAFRTWPIGTGKRRRVNCGKALVFLKSTLKSQQEECEGAYVRLVTHGVLDALAPDDKTVYTVVAYCDTRNLRDFILDPPKTGERVQHAFGVVSAKNVSADNTEFILEQVQLVNQQDAAAATVTARRLWSLTAAACGRADPGQLRVWTQDTDATLKHPLCEDLGSYPTGAVLESPAKPSASAAA